LSVRPSFPGTTFAGWAFTVPVFSLAPLTGAASLPATGLAGALGGAEALSGWVFAATGFGVATALAPVFPAEDDGSGFFESFLVSAFAG